MGRLKRCFGQNDTTYECYWKITSSGLTAFQLYQVLRSLTNQGTPCRGAFLLLRWYLLWNLKRPNGASLPLQPKAKIARAKSYEFGVSIFRFKPSILIQNCFSRLLSSEVELLRGGVITVMLIVLELIGCGGHIICSRPAHAEQGTALYNNKKIEVR